MNDDELSEIDARAAAATVGPWTAHPNVGFASSDDGAGCYAEFLLSAPAKEPPGNKIVVGGINGDWRASPEDLAFIAAARTAVPALVAELRRVRAAVATERAACMQIARDYAARVRASDDYRVGEQSEYGKEIAAEEIADLIAARGAK